MWAGVGSAVLLSVFAACISAKERAMQAAPSGGGHPHAQRSPPTEPPAPSCSLSPHGCLGACLMCMCRAMTSWRRRTRLVWAWWELGPGITPCWRHAGVMTCHAGMMACRGGGRPCVLPGAPAEALKGGPPAPGPAGGPRLCGRVLAQRHAARPAWVCTRPPSRPPAGSRGQHV